MKKIIIILALIHFSTITNGQKLELIKDISQFQSGWFIDPPSGYVNFNGRVFFVATDSLYGRELWSTNGKIGGTQLVKDINPGGFTTDVNLGCPYLNTYLRGIYNGELYFNGLDSTNGMALWKTDGSSTGTSLVKDLNPQGIQKFTFQEPVSYYFNEINGNLVFVGNDSIHGQELWVTDGTTNGTRILSDINKDISFDNGNGQINSFIKFNNNLYFTAYDSLYGIELWVTDGTIAGTKLFIDLQTYNGIPQFASTSSNPTAMYLFNNELYFIDGAGVLYKTDGTSSGTIVLSDSTNNYSPRVEHQIVYNSNTNRAKYFTEMNGKLYFIGSDSATGKELWVTDGTLQGTTMVKELTISNSSFTSIKGEIAELNNKLFFYATDKVPGDPNYIGYQFWQSDGTSSGTSLLKQMSSSFSTSSIFIGQYYTEYDGKLFFRARSDSAFLTLWSTNGTANGTYPLFADSVISVNGYPILYNNRFYFVTASSANSGEELWESGGDSTNTILIRPVGDTTSNAMLKIGGFDPVFYDYAEYNGSLIFSASYGQTGNEAWKLSTTPLSIVSYDKKKLDFSLYPNPANTLINIKTKETLKQTEIYDIKGRLVLKGNKNKVYVSALSNGFYILKIITDQGIGTAKFQINK